MNPLVWRVAGLRARAGRRSDASALGMLGMLGVQA